MAKVSAGDIRNGVTIEVDGKSMSGYRFHACKTW